MSSSSVPKAYLVTYIALLLLLAAAVGVAMIDLGAADPVVALTIAAVKAVLVAIFFMHLRDEQSLIRVVAVTGVVWLLLLFVFLMSDYVVRTSQRDRGISAHQATLTSRHA